MKDSITQPAESGIALVVVLFTLLILSVIGLGMMYSTNLETTINSNYRDKQSALYAALAGLEEGRDRVQPTHSYKISLPTDVPGFVATTAAGSANVIYIISGSSVDPTNPDNSYFDTEFCHENVLGMTPTTAGVPCTSGPASPSGQTYYRPFIDDSLSSSAPWNLSSPLDWKWIRITMKGNNSTPISANGTSSTATEVCWDGTNQVLLPSGYGTNCAPKGSISTITITNSGAGYSSQPTVTISAPTTSGGVTATATANLSSVSAGTVAAISITSAGTGYQSPPTVQISGGGGSGATATATVGAYGDKVGSVAVTDAGTRCYNASFTVTFSGGGGSGAQGTANLASSTSCIYSWAPSAHCTDSHIKGNTITGVTLGGPGSGFTGTLTFDSGGHISSSTMSSNGSGYTSAPSTVSDSGNTLSTYSCTVTPNAVPGYLVSTVTVTSGGSGYTSNPSVVWATGNGIGTTPSATVTRDPGVDGGKVLSITLTNTGSGYTSPPTVTLVPTNGGTEATANATLVTTSVGSITITNAGTGYVANPTVAIDAPPSALCAPAVATAVCTQATATAAVARGSNYGRVYLLTSLAQTQTGSRSMAQMEVATPVLGWNPTGALTLDGPSPSVNIPNSNQFVMDGRDANSCAETAETTHPAIAGYDDPNATPATHYTQSIIDAIPSNRASNYVGAGSSPSVQNSYDALGETLGTPTGLKSLLDEIYAVANTESHTYTGNKTDADIALGSGPNCTLSPLSCVTYQSTDSLGVPIGNAITYPKLSLSLGASSGITTVVDYVDGNLTINGNVTGYGILVVTGTLTLKGNFTWYGVVLVVGDGIVDASGGGNGDIVGTSLVAKIFPSSTNHSSLSSTVGAPSLNWNGGGGNGIRYDHCWATNLIATIPWVPPDSSKPLKVLSFRILPY